MDRNFGLIEIVVFAAIALGFGFWQLYSINREIARDKAAKQAAQKPTPNSATGPGSPTGSGHPEGQHKLDKG
jgi:hypothetical protein